MVYGKWVWQPDVDEDGRLEFGRVWLSYGNPNAEPLSGEPPPWYKAIFEGASSTGFPSSMDNPDEQLNDANLDYMGPIFEVTFPYESDLSSQVGDQVGKQSYPPPDDLSSRETEDPECDIPDLVEEPASPVPASESAVLRPDIDSNYYPDPSISQTYPCIDPNSTGAGYVTRYGEFIEPYLTDPSLTEKPDTAEDAQDQGFEDF